MADERLRKQIRKTSLQISTALQPLFESTSSNAHLQPIVPGLPEIFLQFLQSLRHTTTAFGLSLKQPITIDAAIAQLEKLSDQIARLISCVLAAASGSRFDASALVEEWRDGVLAIIQRFLEWLDGGGSQSEDKAYLMYTGVIWEAIDRSTTRLSTTEISAVCKKWEVQREVVKDAWGEFKNFLEDAEEAGSVDEGDSPAVTLGGGEDEWGELEAAMAKGARVSAEERSRAEAAKPLLGLNQILHETVLRYLPSLALSPEKSYTDLRTASDRLVVAFDESVAAHPGTEEDVDNSLQILKNCSLLIANEIRLRIALCDKASMEGRDQRQQCEVFLEKWVVRAEAEYTRWSERRLSLASLSQAL